VSIPERQSQLDDLIRGHFPDKPKLQDKRDGHRTVPPRASTSRSDEEVVQKARSETGGYFDRLWRGDTSDKGGDHSRADDDAFVHKLWSYTQDEEQIRRIHAASGLSRSNKSECRPDYLTRSINRARENVTWFYEWPEQRLLIKAKPQDEVRSRSRSLGSTGMRNEEDHNLKQSIQACSFSGRAKAGPREWIVDNHVWAGHATSWFGEGGVAKSLLALHLGLAVPAESGEDGTGSLPRL
jgi:hypothetical protein